MTRETRNRTTKTKNRILAIAIEVPATVVKPSTPAMSATTRKVRAQPSMGLTPFTGQKRLRDGQRPFGQAVPSARFVGLTFPPGGEGADQGGDQPRIAHRHHGRGGDRAERDERPLLGQPD